MIIVSIIKPRLHFIMENRWLPQRLQLVSGDSYFTKWVKGANLEVMLSMFFRQSLKHFIVHRYHLTHLHQVPKRRRKKEALYYTLLATDKIWRMSIFLYSRSGPKPQGCYFHKPNSDH